MIGLHAPVHFNKDSTLCVIPNLVQKEFGVQNRGVTVGTCFVAQIAFSIASTTGLKSSTIASHIFKNIGIRGKIDGWTLEEILRTFELPVLTRRGPKWLTLNVVVYHSIQAIFAAISLGYPVITIFPRKVCDAFENEMLSYGDGQAIATVIRPPTDMMFHSLLAIGFEAKSDLAITDTIVFRDSRNIYCLKGYLKVAVDKIEEGFTHVRALSVNVMKVDDGTEHDE